MNLKARLKRAFQQMLVEALPQHTKRIVIAYSGGLDSTVLAYLLLQMKRENLLPQTLLAVHVHHGLQVDADRFEHHARAQTQMWGMDYQAVWKTVIVPSGESVEACARKERYEALQAYVGQHDILVLGQHVDDQAETFLLQALRGSGVGGLASMPPIDFARQFYRPLLFFTKQELLEFAESEHLSWIEDLTNQEIRYDRNFLRHEILPLIYQHFKGGQYTLARAAQNCADSLTVLQEYLQYDLDRAVMTHSTVFNIAVLQDFSILRSTMILKAWIDRLNIFITRVQLEHLWRDVVHAKADAQPELDLGSHVIRRFQSHLYCLAQDEHLKNTDYDLVWDGSEPLVIEGWHEPLRIEKLREMEIDIKCLDWSAVHVHSRIEGLRCHPSTREHSQSLKKVFQEYQIPPWLRSRWPLLSVGDELVCAMDLFVCKKFQSSEI